MNKKLKEIIIINVLNISGVKNPMITLSGQFLKCNSSLMFEVDGKIKKPDYEFVGEYLYFDYKLKFKGNKIKIFLVNDNMKKLIFYTRTDFLKRGVKKLIEIIKQKKKKEIIIDETGSYYNPMIKKDYNKWLSEQPAEKYEDSFEYNPLITVILYSNETPKNLLIYSVNSVINQIYKNWELYIIDDGSKNNDTLNDLERIEKINNKNINIIHSSKKGRAINYNKIINICKGQFITILDGTDVLSSDAFYQTIKILNENKNFDFIYSDDDEIDRNNNYSNPWFKPDFSPDTLLSQNYIRRCAIIRKKIINDVKCFSTILDKATEYDLYLKITEKTNKIYHIHKVLYHWRSSSNFNGKINIDSLEIINGKIAIENALKRRNILGDVKIDDLTGKYIIKYKIVNNPLVSIIIPTKDYSSTLDLCLKSIYTKTKYFNYEVLIVNNNSVEKETFKLFNDYKKKYNNFKVINANIPFNYAKINNIAVKEAKGDYLLLLNNDTEIINGDYLEIMLGYAMQKHIGAVGVKLLYYDNTVQHAGVILGLRGPAWHALVGLKKDEIGINSRLRVPFNYGAVTAACLMTSKYKFKQVGEFDEEFKVALNDVDLNLKYLKAGYYNVVVPQVEIYHYESKSRGIDNTPEKIERSRKEIQRFWKKWKNYLDYDHFYNKNYSNMKDFYLYKSGKK